MGGPSPWGRCCRGGLPAAVAEATQEMVLLKRGRGSALTQKHLSMRSSLFSICVARYSFFLGGVLVFFWEKKVSVLKPEHLPVW